MLANIKMHTYFYEDIQKPEKLWLKYLYLWVQECEKIQQAIKYVLKWLAEPYARQKIKPNEKIFKHVMQISLQLFYIHSFHQVGEGKRFTQCIFELEI